MGGRAGQIALLVLARLRRWWQHWCFEMSIGVNKSLLLVRISVYRLFVLLYYL